VPWSFVIAGAAIGAAVIYLVLANTGTAAEYYMTIKELRACTSCATRTVRVAGVVAPGSIMRSEKPSRAISTVPASSRRRTC
jgi:cytochrome c-type biogenesis protein CcmE